METTKNVVVIQVFKTSNGFMLAINGESVDMPIETRGRSLGAAYSEALKRACLVSNSLRILKIESRIQGLTKHQSGSKGKVYSIWDNIPIEQ